MPKKRIFNKVKVIIVKDYKELSNLAAKIVLKKISGKKKFNLLVPTGTSPIGLYQILSKKRSKLKNCIFFNMDEYCVKKGKKIGYISPTDHRSYHYYMHENLFNQIGQVKHFFPTYENAKEPGTYDKLIKKSGGIDLCINAFGEDGHTFGFNFPGTKFNSITRLVKINDSTKKVNSRLTKMKTPEYGLTTGLKTGMGAKEVLVLASGKRKAEILKKMIYGPITEKVPASILRKHKKCIWIVDEDAASEL